MNKILLVIQREYLTRVKKPSFWILTLVVPILLAGVYAIPIILASRPLEHANVLVVDDSGLFQGQFQGDGGIAGHLLDMVVDDLRSKGISPVYLVTDHTGFYERYGWEFLCRVQGDGEPDMTRMYIHR